MVTRSNATRSLCLEAWNDVAMDVLGGTVSGAEVKVWKNF